MWANQGTEDDAEEPTEPHASCGGHGTLEIREIVQALEKAGITSCMVGVTALMYYGARRARDNWDICVPTKKYQETITLLKSEAFSGICEEISPSIIPQVPLFNTYPLFKRLGVRHLFFRIVPAQAAHLPDSMSTVQSKMGLSYPELSIFIQSAIDRRDYVTLADAIDGMNLSDEWRIEHLDLTYTDDTRWADWANDRMKRANPEEIFGLIPINAFDRKVTWQNTVRRKQTRGGWKYPKERDRDFV